jgi:excisionase family DNA binding protein
VHAYAHASVFLEKNVQQRLAVSIEDAVTASGLGRSKVYEEIRDGRLVARKVGKRTLILMTDLQAWLEAFPKIAPKQQG